MKTKKNKKLIRILEITLMGLLLFCGCQNTKKQINKDYPQLVDKKHVFKEIDVNKLTEMFTDAENFYLVMGFSECPWCQSLMPVLNDVSKENGVELIYYLNIKQIRDNKDAKGYDDFLNLTSSYFQNIIDKDKNRVNAPTFVKVENGVVVKYHLNTVSSHIKNENNYLPPLDANQLSELKEILNNIFK